MERSVEGLYKKMKLLLLCVTAVILSSVSWLIWDRRTNKIYFKTRRNHKNIGGSYGTQS